MNNQLYELDLRTHVKNRYTIVYSNKTYLYYKTSGSDILRSIQCSTVISYDDFKQLYSHYHDTHVYIINAPRNPDFSFVDGFSHAALSAEEQNRRIQAQINAINAQIKRSHLIITSCQHTLDINRKKIEQYQEQIRRITNGITDIS